MAYISSVVLPDNSSYDIKDKNAAPNDAGFYFGTCSTAEGTATKVVSIQDSTFPSSLTTGLHIKVLFNSSNTASSPKLNVNSLGAKPIALWPSYTSVTDNNVTYKVANRLVTDVGYILWYSSQVVDFYYDADLSSDSNNPATSKGVWIVGPQTANTILPMHTIDGDSGWYKWFEISFSTGMTRSITFLITFPHYYPLSGILKVYMNRNSGNIQDPEISWISRYGNIDVRYVKDTTNNKYELYILKRHTTGRLSFSVLECVSRAGNYQNPLSYFRAESVSELPASAVSISDASYIKSSVYYGTCSTAADTPAKEVSVVGTHYTPPTNIRVMFTKDQGATSPTLNVNSTGAYPIRLYATDNSSYNIPLNFWAAGTVVDLEFSTTYNCWVVMGKSGWATTKYYGLTKLEDSTSNTSTTTAATPNSVKSAYDLAAAAVPKTTTVNGKALSSNITLAASDVGAVPTTRTINSKALSSNISLTASDVGAVPTTRTVNSKALSANITLSASDVGAVPTTRTVNSKALSSDITLTASDVSAVPTTRTINSKALSSNITLTASDVSAVPTTRKVNNKALSSDITLSASDVSAVPTTRTVNSKALSSDITLAASDVGALASANALSELYGECDTAAGNQQKEVSIPGVTSLTAGVHITVRFTKIQSYDGTPTLKVNSLDAKSIYRATSSEATLNEWYAGAVLDFVYNGTVWVIVNKGHATTNYWGQTKLSSAIDSTSTSLAATPSAVKQAYDLAAGKALIRDGTYYGSSSTAATTQTKVVTITSSQFPTSLVDGLQIVVLFTNTQSYNGQPYLNVNGTGARPVILNTYSGAAAGTRAWIGGGYSTFWYYAASDAWVLDRGYSTKLFPSYTTTVSASSTSTGYREIFRIPADNQFSMVLLIENHHVEYSNGILSIRIDSGGAYVQWYAKSLKNASRGWSGQYGNIRYEVVDIVTDNTTVSTFILYAYKGTNSSYGLDFTVLSCTSQTSGNYVDNIQWTNTAVTEADFLLKSAPIPCFEPPIVSTSISLGAANNWSTETSGYYWDTTTVGTADITTNRFTNNTQVSFNPTAEQLYAFIQDGVSALIAETTTISGTRTLRIHALGNAPNTAYQSLSNKAIPITLTEVLAT